LSRLAKRLIRAAAHLASHGLKHGSVDWATYRRRLEHLIRLASVALDPA
jgi:hypothetical protein